jgi:hypothetical protein
VGGIDNRVDNIVKLIFMLGCFVLASLLHGSVSAQQPDPLSHAEAKAPNVVPSDEVNPNKSTETPATFGPSFAPCPVGLDPTLHPPAIVPPFAWGVGQAECRPSLGEYYDPFNSLPETRRIAEPDRASDPKRDDKRPANSAETEMPAFVQAVFAEPAHFAWAGHTASGHPIMKHAVVIYEGMTVLIYSNGEYAVNFVAEIPDMPVTLRLQFRVDRMAGLAGTITLPPITFSPEGNDPRHSGSQSWTVTHKGYSPLLVGLCSNCAGCRFARDGMARFGTLPLQPADMIPSPTISAANSRSKKFCNGKIFLD